MYWGNLYPVQQGLVLIGRSSQEEDQGGFGRERKKELVGPMESRNVNTCEEKKKKKESRE